MRDRARPRVRFELGPAVSLVAAIACSPSGTQPARHSTAPPDDTPTERGLVELASGSAVVCARYADGRAACWGPRENQLAIDLEGPERLGARDVDGIQVVEGRVWIRRANKGWTSLSLHTPFVESPVAPPADARSALMLDGITCVQHASGQVSCELHDKARAAGAGARISIADAAGADELLLTVSDGKPWLCGRKAAQVACWSTSGRRVDVAHGVRLLGRGERVCVQHDDGRLACLRDDASLEKSIEWDVIATYPPLGALGIGRELGCAQLDPERVECWWWKQEYADHADAGMTYVGELRGQPTRVPGLRSVSALSVGAAHACVLEAGGQLSCWGRVVPEKLRPLEVVQVAVTRASAIALGGKHACVIQHEVAWCWGDNRHGQLGQAKTTESAAPVFIDLSSGVTELALGERHTCVRTVDGKVHCFGDAAEGRLGRGGAKSPWLTEVTGVRDATRIRAGKDVTCAIERGQTVKCWGKLGEQGVERAVTLSELQGASDLGIDSRVICGLIGEKVVCSSRRKKAELHTPRSRDTAELAGRCSRSKAGQVACFDWQRTEGIDGYGEALVSLEVSDVDGAQRIWSGAHAGCARTAKGTRCFLLPSMAPQVPVTSGPLIMPGTLTDVVDVAIAEHQVCAVEAKGHAWCAGGFDAPVRPAGPEPPWTLVPGAAKMPDQGSSVPAPRWAWCCRRHSTTAKEPHGLAG